MMLQKFTSKNGDWQEYKQADKSLRRCVSWESDWDTGRESEFRSPVSTQKSRDDYVPATRAVVRWRQKYTQS